MRVTFVAQPYDDQTSLREFLEEVCADTRYTTLTCVVAWAKRSGLSVVADALRAFAARGESVLLVGISQGGATRQGLALAIDLFDRVFVVYDTGVTFHPKVYLAEGPEVGRLWVGSMNLTAGGLQANYEAALDIQLSSGEEPDRQLQEAVRSYVKRLIEDIGITLALDEDLLESLASSPRYRIRNEDTAPPAEPDEATGAGEGPDEGTDLFGRSREKKRGFPARRSGSATRERPATYGSPQTTAAVPQTRVPAAPLTPRRVVRRWSKVLPPDNAQHPENPGTHPTGSLRLTMAKHPIDFRTWFRRSLFGGMPWEPNPDRAGDALDLEFVVSLPGRPDKSVRLRVAHDPRREAGQNNFATTIHWGDLMPDLRATNFTGQVVTIERYSDDTFRLTIAPAETGPFLE